MLRALGLRSRAVGVDARSPPHLPPWAEGRGQLSRSRALPEVPVRRPSRQVIMPEPPERSSELFEGSLFISLLER